MLGPLSTIRAGDGPHAIVRTIEYGGAQSRRFNYLTEVIATTIMYKGSRPIPWAVFGPACLVCIVSVAQRRVCSRLLQGRPPSRRAG